MTENARVVSKVLVLESRKEYFDVVKIFCDENNLVGLRAHKDNVMSILKSNVDMGAILLSEHYGGNPTGGIALAHQIHAVRPELPIFLRRESSESLDDMDSKVRQMFCAAYTIGSMFRLRRYIEEYIFSFVYPNVLVRGIKEMTENALVSQFHNVTVSCDTPYMVRDKIIYGEIFSLIPIESSWCRGYMMLQTEDPSARVAADSRNKGGDGSNTRNVTSVLGEVTNLIWGAFKNKYIEEGEQGRFQTQVPIIINHHQKYISFGSEDPQLCFKYVLTDNTDESKPPINVYQRFIFNLNWSPEDFKEVQTSCEDLVESGELELF